MEWGRGVVSKNAWMWKWKSDAKVNVGESNFCVVKYLSLEFGIYMDYFGTDV